MCFQPPAKPQILFCLFKKKSTTLCYKRGLGPEEVKKKKFPILSFKLKFREKSKQETEKNK